MPPILARAPNSFLTPPSPTGPLAQNGYGAGTRGLGEASVRVLELWGGLSPAPHFSPGFGGGAQTQKPGEPQPHLCLCPLPGVCGPFPPHLHLHLSPQDVGMETDWELSQVRVVGSGGFHMPVSFPASFPGLMRAGERLRGAGRKPPGFQPSGLASASARPQIRPAHPSSPHRPSNTAGIRSR